MRKIIYFDKDDNGDYAIILFNTVTNKPTTYTIKHDFTPFHHLKLSRVINISFDDWIKMKRQFITIVNVSTVKQIDLLLSAEKSIANYPEGFRKKLEEMKNTIKEVAELFSVFNAGQYKKMILGVAKRYPNEVREFLNESLSDIHIKNLSSALLDVMREEKALFDALDKMARLCPDTFHKILRECTESIADYAPVVPRPI